MASGFVTTRRARNPGPPFGYRFLRLCDRVLPEPLFRPLRAAGTAVAVAAMPAQRATSRHYLGLVLGRSPTLGDVWRHFLSLEESLMLKLRVANGRQHTCTYGTGGDDFRAWMRTGGAVLLGTMHVGDSDLLGFRLAKEGPARVVIVRRRVGNSHDTEALQRFVGPALRLVWINEPDEMLIALKQAGEDGAAVALQCDRADHSARTAEFEFLGARRPFPITIYHLAAIFQRPVLHSVGISTGATSSILHASPAFTPRPGERRAEVVARGLEHFQDWLRRLEGILRDHPYAWHNFDAEGSLLHPSTGGG